MVCRLTTCCGISPQSPVTVRVAGGRGNAFGQRSLSDTPIGRLADSGVNEKRFWIDFAFVLVPLPGR